MPFAHRVLRLFFLSVLCLVLVYLGVMYLVAYLVLMPVMFYCIVRFMWHRASEYDAAAEAVFSLVIGVILVGIWPIVLALYIVYRWLRLLWDRFIGDNAVETMNKIFGSSR